MGGVVLGILVWQEGGDYVVLLIAIGALALWALARWLVRRHREGKVTLLDPDLFRLPHFRLGFTGQMLQNITLGGAMIALPIFLQIKLEYDALETGLSLAPLSLTMFAVAILAGRRSGGRRASEIIRAGFALSTLGMALIVPIVPRADSGWYLLIPLVIAGAGLGLLVSQLNNYTLAPIDEERISEAAGVNSASGSFGLSFGLAVAGGVLLATLSLAFTNMTNASPVIPSSQQQQIAQTLEDDAQVVSNTQLEELLADEPPAVQEEILAHQHRRDEPRPSGGAARADPRRPARALQLVPHDATAGHRALGLHRSGGVGVVVLRIPQQFQRSRIGWRPAVAADVRMQAPIPQIGGLHDPCQAPGAAGRARDQLEMSEVAAIRARVGRPVEKPEGAQLIAREARDEQLPLGHGGPLEDLVQPGHGASLLGHRARDTPHVPDHRRSVLLAVAAVQPLGDRPCAFLVHRDRDRVTTALRRPRRCASVIRRWRIQAAVQPAAGRWPFREIHARTLFGA